MKTREEIKKRIEELTNRQFYLNMKDTWNNKDFEMDRELTREIRELKKELEEV